MDNPILGIFQLVVLIFSVIIHEISHGYMAERLGDPTARLAGRLTLNPISHIDPIGSIAVPLLLLITGSPFLFGWAKPVPFNPSVLRDPLVGGAKIAAAGPMSNLALAAVFAVILRLVSTMGLSIGSNMVVFFGIIIFINILLAIFNLVPLPPLDGSKVLFALLPPDRRGYEIMGFLNRYGMFLLLLFIFFGFGLIMPIIDGLFTLFVGFGLGVIL